MSELSPDGSHRIRDSGTASSDISGGTQTGISGKVPAVPPMPRPMAKQKPTITVCTTTQNSSFNKTPRVIQPAIAPGHIAGRITTSHSMKTAVKAAIICQPNPANPATSGPI